MQKRLRKKVIVGITLAVICFLALFLAVSIAVQQSKADTCPSVVDVWRDIQHLTQQKGENLIDHSHVLNSLRVYLNSHALDGILYEWRMLEESSLLPQNTESQYIWWPVHNPPVEAQGRDPAKEISVQVMLYFEGHTTEFHNNPNTLEYTSTVNTVEIDGRVRFGLEDGGLLWNGYSSKITFCSYITEAPGPAHTEKEVFQGALFDQFGALPANTDGQEFAGAKKDPEIIFDPGISQYLRGAAHSAGDG